MHMSDTPYASIVMQKPGYSYKALTSESFTSIRAKQANILAEINALNQAPLATPTLNRSLFYLREHYNTLIDQLIALEPSPYSDPIQVLPPELWTVVLEYVIEGMHDPLDTLLMLTLVSKSWQDALLFTSTLWSTVVLDNRRADHQIKAFMSIHLARTSRVHLSINISSDSWQNIAALVGEASERIFSLSLHVYNADDPINCILEILDSLPYLPNLAELHILQAMYYPFRDVDFHRLRIDRFPSLKGLNGPSLPNFEGPWNRLVISDKQTVNSVTNDTLKLWARSPSLQTVIVDERARTVEELDVLIDLIQPPLSSIMTFTYFGPAVDRGLRWIGRNLQRLTMNDITSTGNSHTIFMSLAQFPCLQYLELEISTPLNEMFTRKLVDPKIALPSVKELCLRFIKALRADDDSSLETIHPFCNFIAISLPNVKTLKMRDRSMMQPMLSHIETFNCLQDLDIGPRDRRISLEPRPVVIKSGTINRIRIPDVQISNILSGLNTPNLRSLEVGAKSQSPKTENVTPDGRVELYSYQLSNISFRNLTTLRITLLFPVSWQLGFLPHLQELALVQHSPPFGSSIFWASDILEGILMQPLNTPSLEKLTLRGDFYEWDILILMLERKNFLPHPGISRIKNLVMDRFPSYQLLYLLSTLLGGKFVERESNFSYSIEAFGNRLWNIESNGCMRCISLLQKCDRSTRSGRDWGIHPGGVMPFEWNYKYPSEYLVADPPLNPDLIDWLSGKYRRRQKYVEGYKSAFQSFHRAKSCIAASLGEVTISEYTLEGFPFAEEAGMGG